MTNVLVAGSAVRIDCLRLNGDVLEVALPSGARPPQIGELVHLRLLVQRLYPAQL